MQGHRYFQVEKAAGAAIVRLTESHLCGDIVGEVIRLELSEFIEAKHPRRLLIDFQQVKMISSSVIAAFLSVKRKLDQYGARLTLCAMPIPIREVYRTLQLDGNVFDVCESAAEAQTETRQPVPSRTIVEQTLWRTDRLIAATV